MDDKIHWFYLVPNSSCQILTQEYEKDIFQCWNINRQKDAKKDLYSISLEIPRRNLEAGEVGSRQDFIRAVERKQRKNLKIELEQDRDFKVQVGLSLKSQ